MIATFLALSAEAEAFDPLDGRSLALSLLAAAGLLLLNALFVAYEFAVIAARRATIETAAEQGRATAQAALDSFRDLSVQLAGAQLGITIASLGLGRVGEPAVASILESLAGDALPHDLVRFGSLALALTIVVFLHLVIGEMVPKNIAIAQPEPTLRMLVLPYRAYLTVMKPVVYLLNAMANVGCRLVGVEPRDEMIAAHSAAELAAIVTHASEEGAIEADSAALLRSALAFAERPVGEIARPLEDVTTIRLGTTPAQAEHAIQVSGQNRVPIIAPSLEEERFVGYLHVKDLLPIEGADRFLPLPSALTRRMAVLRADVSMIEALRSLRRVHRQLAVVVSDHGPIGVVSVEEIIRGLVQGPVSEREATESG